MLVKKTETETVLDFKAVTSISRKGVLGLVIMSVLSFLMEFVFAEGGFIVIPTWLKWVLYVTAMTAVVIMGVDKPEMKKFLVIIKEALSDGKITLEEAMAMIRQGWFVLMGFWADVSQIENKEKKADIEKAVEIAKLKAEIEALKTKDSKTDP